MKNLIKVTLSASIPCCVIGAMWSGPLYIVVTGFAALVGLACTIVALITITEDHEQTKEQLRKLSYEELTKMAEEEDLLTQITWSATFIAGIAHIVTGSILLGGLTVCNLLVLYGRANIDTEISKAIKEEREQEMLKEEL